MSKEINYQIKPLKLPEIKSNFIEVKQDLLENVMKFKIEVTEDNIQEAKDMMATLNKIKARIIEKQKETIVFYTAPTDKFKLEVGELIEIVENSRDEIAVQVSRFETETKKTAEILLISYIAELRTLFNIDSKFYSAEYRDLVLLGSVTGKGALTKGAREKIDARIAREQSNQNLYRGRLKEVESECFKCGIEPFTESSVSHILMLDFDKFTARLSSLINNEIARNEKIKADADRKAREEFDAIERAKIRAEEVKKLQDEAKAKIARDLEDKIEAEKERKRLANEAQEKYKADFAKQQAEELAKKPAVEVIENEDRQTGRTNSLYTQQQQANTEKFRPFSNHEDRYEKIDSAVDVIEKENTKEAIFKYERDLLISGGSKLKNISFDLKQFTNESSLSLATKFNNCIDAVLKDLKDGIRGLK